MKIPVFNRLRKGPQLLLMLALALSALIGSFALSLRAAPPFQRLLVYVITFNNQFGVVDLATGSFRQIGPVTPEGQANLVWWNGSLLSLTVTGELEKINPATGETSDIGPTGLGFNAIDLGEARGKLYATDFNNNIYSVNPATGAATLLNVTGIPPIPTVPFSVNSDGTVNVFDESLYGGAGKLYATFDALTIDPTTLAETPDSCCGPTLYQIDPSTGSATAIGPTKLGLGSTVEVNGEFYAFRWVPAGCDPCTPASDFTPLIKSQLFKIDLRTGTATPVANGAGPIFVDAAAGGIVGAAPYFGEWEHERKHWR
jgi:hypothetical protein